MNIGQRKRSWEFPNCELDKLSSVVTNSNQWVGEPVIVPVLHKRYFVALLTNNDNLNVWNIANMKEQLGSIDSVRLFLQNQPSYISAEDVYEILTEPSVSRQRNLCAVQQAEDYIKRFERKAERERERDVKRMEREATKQRQQDEQEAQQKQITELRNENYICKRLLSSLLRHQCPNVLIAMQTYFRNDGK